jgi:hypothetical protein
VLAMINQATQTQAYEMANQSNSLEVDSAEDELPSLSNSDIPDMITNLEIYGEF